MQPRIVEIVPQRTMELNGLRWLWLMRPKNPLKGVALSRASVQNTRLAVRKQPITAINDGRKARIKSPSEPPADPVA